MTTTTLPPIAQVRDAGGTLADDIRAVRMIWKREMIRTFRNKLRILTSLAQPVLFLFVLGAGLSPIVKGGQGTVDFKTFMFPGVIAMTVVFTSIFSAMSIVWDREFGFLREMLVAPVRRGALVVGKCLGGATIASMQGLIMVVLAPAVGVRYHPVLLIVILEMALAALTLSAFGIVIAARISQLESFQMVSQFIVLPMFFLSGAMFPLTGLPTWLATLAKLDPLTYAVDPMRRAVFSIVSAPARVQRSFNPGVTWNGWRVPVGLELVMVAVIGVVLLAVAVVQFSKAD